MAGTSLLALIDDITSVLDDVAAMTKVAARKTAGVLGDDLALNAQQVDGVRAERELPVVLAVARGSLVNKAILVPMALTVSAFAPWAVSPLLMVGGAYLCFEGAEKLIHRLLHKAIAGQEEAALHAALLDPQIDLVAVERDKIRGAIRTDFVLSSEIIVISLGSVAGAALSTQLVVLVGISLIMTGGVYGLVAAIVKMDDAGLHLSRRTASGPAIKALGRGLLTAAPLMMKALAVLGTAAMFTVGGGILVHGVPPLYHAIRHVGEGVPWVGAAVPPMVHAGLGVAAGAVLVAGFSLARRLFKRGHPRRPSAR